jgi:hypothetical protein
MSPSSFWGRMWPTHPWATTGNHPLQPWLDLKTLILHAIQPLSESRLIGNDFFVFVLFSKKTCEVFGIMLKLKRFKKIAWIPITFSGNSNFDPENLLEVLTVEAKHCWELSTNFGKKKFVDIAQQCFALKPQVDFLANILTFHWRWWDW